MWTGTSALKNIDQTLQTIRNEAVRLDSQLSQLTESLAANQRQRLKVINDIAAVRLLEIQRDELNDNYTAADQFAASELEKRDTALDQLNRTIDSLTKDIEHAEMSRAGLLAKVNDSSQQIVDIEAQVQNQLAADAFYLELLNKAQAADSIMQEARQKAEQAEIDFNAKAEPYQNDPLFMYLWERGFSTTEYQGGLFSRAIDAWVAKLVKYPPARVNYWNLTEIPKRLAEHASSVSDVADQQRMAVQQMEINKLQEAGIQTLEEEEFSWREKLDNQDDTIEEFENKLNAQLQQRTRFTAGEDDYIQRCIARLAKVLQHKDVQAIHSYALATPSPTDDQLVIELQNIENNLQDLQGDLSHVRLLHDKKTNKLKELGQVRRKFKDSRYDDVRSGFGNKAILASVLGEFLRGAVSGNDLWRTIKRNQRYRNVGSIPDFGSGGLGDIGDILGGGTIGRSRSQRNSSWHFPSPRRGGGGFKIPRGGSGGGGFKTGGSF